MPQHIDDRRRDGATFSFLAGGGEGGDLIAAKDWAMTTLGPLDSWPQA